MHARELLEALGSPGPHHDYGTNGQRSAWLDMDWRSHVREAEVDGRSLSYVDLGSGPAIVWVHGLGASWQCWLENLPAFARDHRVIAMDLPGFGRSRMPREEISITAYARSVCHLLDHLGIECATVVGNSMGGFIGAELAIRHPERVERLVLVSAAVFWQEYRRARPLVSLARLTEASFAKGVAAAQGHLAIRPRLRHAALATAGVRYPQLLAPELSIELIRTARRTAGFVPAVRALAAYPLRDELPRIAAPTLVVWGAHDTLVGVRHAFEMERLIPNAELVVFERTGHVPMLERPDRFNRVMREFLAETEPFGEAEVGPFGEAEHAAGASSS
jgi:pimeloyl-ACP methyl ester carboxylesterase